MISGLATNKLSDRKTFHAGTVNDNGAIVTAGGRVLCATVLGQSVHEAQKAAYALLHELSWDDVQFRTDIAYRAIEREQS